ncbi:MAG TPA: GNAT family N-acetyltransferase [Chthoniobacterales bacterium]|jgi:GNAT superfamily N-acetyltransferase
MTTTQREVITTYLEMTSPNELCAKHSDDPHFRVAEVPERDWRLNRSLYLDVGEPWAWNDKRNWSEERWRAYVERDSLRTFVANYDDKIAGYFELVRENAEVEIAYFGLLPDFFGRGLGAALLTSAIEEAWRWNATRVWVHTCSLDHPAALRNYEARGMRPFKTSRRSP